MAGKRPGKRMQRKTLLGGSVRGSSTASRSKNAAMKKQLKTTKTLVRGAALGAAAVTAQKLSKKRKDKPIKRQQKKNKVTVKFKKRK